jgi:hypothetical protein
MIQPTGTPDGTVTWKGKELPWLSSAQQGEGCYFTPFGADYVEAEPGKGVEAGLTWIAGARAILTCTVEGGDEIWLTWLPPAELDLRGAMPGPVQTDCSWLLRQEKADVTETNPTCTLEVISRTGGPSPFPDLVSADFEAIVRYTAVPTDMFPLAFSGSAKLDRSNFRGTENAQCPNVCDL